MAFLTLTGVQKVFPGGVAAVEDFNLDVAARRVRVVPRTVRLRQDHDPPDDRRLREADRRDDHGRRQGHHLQAAEPAQRRDGLPVVRAVPEHVGRRQHRLRDEGPQAPEGRDRPARRGAARADAPAGPRRPLPVAAVRRPAAARRARAGARHRAAGPAARRTAVRARRQDPDRPAQGDPGDPAPARDHDGVRHPRPGGGPLAVRPGRGHERGPHRADRDAVGDLQLPDDRVRRLVRRARSTSSTPG